MSDEISYSLFDREGYLNTTPARFYVPFWDQDTGQFRRKQSRDFDGGWRWFESHEGDCLTIYNTKLHPRAYATLTRTDMVDSRLQPETLLNFTRAHAIMEHGFCVATDQLIDYIQAIVNRARREIKEEICGESSNGSHLRAVR